MSLSETRFGANATGLPSPAPLPSLTSALSRRAALFGAVTVAGCTATSVVPAIVHADPFTRYGNEILALQKAINACKTDEASDPLMDRWGEIDRLAMARQPTTLAGAIGALEYARREFHQFHIEATEDCDDEVCPGDCLVLHLLDGAIDVLRQAVGGGVA